LAVAEAADAMVKAARVTPGYEKLDQVAQQYNQSGQRRKEGFYRSWNGSHQTCVNGMNHRPATSRFVPYENLEYVISSIRYTGSG
jgi:hypothetical protein